jgi:hypothetical protein
LDASAAHSSEFGPEQELAFALTGTVALPSPFPATGRVSILVVRETQAPDDQPHIKVFLKSVQVVNVQCIVTRIVAREAVRAIGYYSNGQTEAMDGVWTVVPIERFLQTFATASQAAKDLENDRGCSFEVPLLLRAVLYVPESAQVLHRIELGLTAAVSAGAPVPITSEQELRCCC